MLSYTQLQSLGGGWRYGPGQAGNLARSAVVNRLVVANATRLRARAEAENEEAVFSVSSGLQLKSRRNRAVVPSQSSRDITGEHSSPSNVGDAEELDGAAAAALRDATATASTSGSSGSSSSPPAAHSLPKQRRLPFRSSAAAAAAATATPLSFTSELTSTDSTQSPSTASLGSGDNGHHQAQNREQQQQPPSSWRPAAAVHPLPAGVTPERDREIHDELRGCEDWRDVLDIVADEAECLSVRTAVHALTRLNTLTLGSVATRRELVEHTAFQALKELLYSQVSLMNNVQLSNSLHAFAQLQVALPELLLEGYAAAATARADNFFPRDIATLLAAAAAMHWSPPQELLDALGFRAMGFLAAREFDARSIPTLLHSIALLGYKNPLLAAAAAQRLAAPGVMASLAPQGVANSLWALGRLDTYHPPAVDAALAAFSSAPLSYKPQEVANLLWSLTAFRHHPEAAFVTFARSLLNRPDGQIRAADLATLMYALGLFNVSPGARVLERMEAVGLQLLDAAAAKAAAAAEGGATPPPPPPPPAGTRRGAMSVVELAHMYWGLALLGKVEGPLFGRLEAELAAAWEREGADIPESLLRVAFQGWVASKLEVPRRPHAFPALAMDALKRAWTGRLLEQGCKKGRGRRVDEVASILDALKVTYDKRRPTGDGLAVIDIALKAGLDRYIALQLVDTADRCANSKQLLGPAVISARLLEKNGWEVRYVRAADLDSLAPELRTRFVGELLQNMGVKVRKGAAAAAGGGSASGPSEDAAAAPGAAGPGSGAAAAAATSRRSLNVRARR